MIPRQGRRRSRSGPASSHRQRTSRAPWAARWGNGVLDISGHDGDLRIGSLTLSGGVVKTALGNNQTTLHLTDQLMLENGRVTFGFSKGASFRLNRTYMILNCPNLSSFDVSQFAGNSIDRARPTFELAGNQLVVSFRR